MNVRARARAGGERPRLGFFSFVHHDYEVTTARRKKKRFRLPKSLHVHNWMLNHPLWFGEEYREWVRFGLLP